MAKDAKGHGSEKRGGVGQVLPADQRANTARAIARAAATPGTVEYDRAAAAVLGEGNPKSGQAPVHSGAAGRTDGRITIFHQDGEYAVPNGGKGHYFTNDKQDAEATARHIHGKGISIKHRSKRWGPEMD